MGQSHHGGEGGVEWGGGGRGGVLASSLGTHCETDPESGGGDKQRQKSSDRPIPLYTRAVGHL